MVYQKMPQQHVSFLIFSFMFFVVSVSGTNSHNYFSCSPLNFDVTSPYEMELNSLFSSIIDLATVSNFSTFPGNSQSRAVYGLFQCQGDQLNSQCKECVTNSVSQLRSNCPGSMNAIIQLERCFVKYDNVPFFGVEDKTETWKSCGLSIGFNLDVFNSIDTTLSYLTTGNGQYFRKADFGSIHGVAQCTQDLSVSDCQDCLLETSVRLKSYCERSSWGDMYLGKCYIRYTDKTSSDYQNGGVGTEAKVERGTIFIVIIGGVVTAFVVSAVVSYFISSRVAEAKVKPVKRDAVDARKHAEEAKRDARVAIRDAGEAKRDAGEAIKDAGDAIQEAKAASDIASRASNRGSIQSHRTRF